MGYGSGGQFKGAHALYACLNANTQLRSTCTTKARMHVDSKGQGKIFRRRVGQPKVAQLQGRLIIPTFNQTVFSGT